MNLGNTCERCGHGATSSNLQQPEVKSSPVHDLLHNNLPPRTIGELKAARQTLSEIQQDLDGVDETISHIRTALQRLLTKRAVLQDYADAHQGVLSYMRRIPTEILSEIFIHTLPAFPFELSAKDAPLLLERVCQRWKDVVRSTSLLWSYIQLDIGHGEDSRTITRIATCLSRSREHSLTIAVNGRNLEHQDLKSRFSVLRLLTHQCSRWQTVHLKLPLWAIRKYIIVGSSLLRLHTLHLDITSDVEEDDSTKPLDCFSSAPKLKTLALTSTDLSDIVTNGSMIIPWANLTSLAIDERKAGEIWGMLQNCPNLEHFGAYISYDAPHGCSAVPPMKLAHLHSLSLKIPLTSTILSTLTLPAVQSLSFTLIDDVEPDGFDWDPSVTWVTHSGLDVLISQSQCTILKLSFPEGRMQTVFEPEDVTGCLKAMPSLIELEAPSTLAESVVRSLAHHSHCANPLVPKLRKLVLRVTRAEFPWVLLGELLELRRAASSPIELLQIFKLEVDEEIFSEGRLDLFSDTIHRLQDEGLGVEISRVY
ncbi:hypothetical protein HWV62_29485 [Athelia sp. TMB]|nr:hypothetical protein HWV62_29485 [Athelia sp. TMB]